MLKKIISSLTIVAVLMVGVLMSTPAQAADGSININSAVLSFTDNDSNNYVNIGDEVTVTVVIDNEDFATQTVTADLTDYGGDAAETLSATGTPNGTNDEYQVTITVSDGNAEYAADAAGSAVTVTVDDGDEVAADTMSTNTFGAAMGADNGVDTDAPSNQNTVFASNLTVNPGATVTIISSGDENNDIWFAPNGTTTFTAGATMTTAVSGTATSITAPSSTGNYKIYIIDAAGNRSAASTATLGVSNPGGAGGNAVMNITSSDDDSDDDNETEDDDADEDSETTEDATDESDDDSTSSVARLVVQVLHSDMAMAQKVVLLKMLLGLL